MKIAIIHEMLIKLGGAERVLEVLMQAYPEADVYTLMYDAEKVGSVFPKAKIHCTGPAQWLFQYTQKPRWSLPLMPFSIWQIDVSGYDIVISSSSGFAHWVWVNTKYTVQNTQKRPIHICYCHSPARYLWDWTEEIQNEIFTKYKIHSTKYTVIHSLKLLGIPFVKLLLWWLRRVDLRASKSPDVYIANSQEVQERIKKYYGRESEVIWPPIDVEKYTLVDRSLPSKSIYYVITSALTPFKRVDIPVRVLSELGIPLKIIGAGDQRRELEQLAGPAVEFLWRISDQEVLEIYAGARGFLMPQKEDAGMAPIEAMVAGLPVFGQRAGGLIESNIDGITGRFFDEESDESFREAFLQFHDEITNQKYDDSMIFRRHVQRYNTNIFLEKIRKIIDASTE